MASAAAAAADGEGGGGPPTDLMALAFQSTPMPEEEEDGGEEEADANALGRDGYGGRGRSDDDEDLDYPDPGDAEGQGAGMTMAAHGQDGEAPAGGDYAELAQQYGVAEDVMRQALQLGMDPAEDYDLLYIAEESLGAALPEGWSELEDENGNLYFYNEYTEMSQWEHPLDDLFKERYRKMKAEKRKVQQQQPEDSAQVGSEDDMAKHRTAWAASPSPGRQQQQQQQQHDGYDYGADPYGEHQQEEYAGHDAYGYGGGENGDTADDNRDTDEQDFERGGYEDEQEDMDNEGADREEAGGIRRGARGNDRGRTVSWDDEGQEFGDRGAAEDASIGDDAPRAEMPTVIAGAAGAELSLVSMRQEITSLQQRLAASQRRCEEVTAQYEQEKGAWEEEKKDLDSILHNLREPAAGTLEGVEEETKKDLQRSTYQGLAVLCKSLKRTVVRAGKTKDVLSSAHKSRRAGEEDLGAAGAEQELEFDEEWRESVHDEADNPDADSNGEDEGLEDRGGARKESDSDDNGDEGERKRDPRAASPSVTRPGAEIRDMARMIFRMERGVSVLHRLSGAVSSKLDDTQTELTDALQPRTWSQILQLMHDSLHSCFEVGATTEDGEQQHQAGTGAEGADQDYHCDEHALHSKLLDVENVLAIFRPYLPPDLAYAPVMQDVPRIDSGKDEEDKAEDAAGGAAAASGEEGGLLQLQDMDYSTAASPTRSPGKSHQQQLYDTLRRAAKLEVDLAHVRSKHHVDQQALTESQQALQAEQEYRQQAQADADTHRQQCELLRERIAGLETRVQESALREESLLNKLTILSRSIDSHTSALQSLKDTGVLPTVVSRKRAGRAGPAGLSDVDDADREAMDETKGHHPSAPSTASSPWHGDEEGDRGGTGTEEGDDDGGEGREGTGVETEHQLREKLRLQEEELEVAVTELAAARDEIDLLRRRANDAEEGVSNTEEQSKFAWDRAQEAEKRVEDLMQVEVELRNQLSAADMRLEKKKEKITKLQKRKEELERTAKDIFHSLETATAEREAQARELDDLRNQLEMHERVVERKRQLETENEQNRERVLVLQEELDGMQRNVEALEEEKALIAQRVHELEQEGVSLTADLNQAREDVAAEKRKGHRDIHQLQQRVEALRREKRQLNERVLELQGNMRVMCRVRPLADDEMRELHLTEESLHQRVNFPDSHLLDFAGKVYEFDRVFSPADTQEEVFDEIEPAILSTLNGYKACIFAYGQTGSGKTYTMEGTPENRGVSFRATHALFARAAREEHELGIHTTFHVSVLEVYNETLRDLLDPDPSPAKPIEIKATKSGVVVKGLVQCETNSAEEVEELLQEASEARTVGNNNINEHSSRSHLVLQLHVERSDVNTGKQIVGRLNLVDLAGSERLKATKVAGDRLTETQHINRSLFALGEIVQALATNARHVPYRNSKLTYLLQDSLSANSKVLMFVNVNPASVLESNCSLTFALRCRTVQFGQARRIPTPGGGSSPAISR